jgi:hypothetical protein
MQASEQDEAMRIEALLLEWREAEQCNLFRATPLRAEALRHAKAARPQPLVFRLAVAGLAMAACLALFALALTWRAGDHARIASNNTTGSGLVDSSDSLLATLRFSGCVAGPKTDPVSSDCASVDFDRDGDVDLADYSAVQVAATHSM